MSSNITVYPFTNKIGTTLTPHFPGAYIVSGATGANGLVPIYTSIADFASNAMTDILNDKDRIVIVLPGFTLQLYSNTNYGDDAYVYTLGTFDNSGGTDVLYGIASMVASSCKLYYKSRIGFKELLLVADTFNPVSTINTGSLTISPSYNATSTVTYSGTNYRLYEFKSTTINSTFSYTGSSAITIRFLLVGGGGCGGYGNNGVDVAGPGGGGAGAFVYGTIVVSPGDTFTVQIGNGGAGSSIVGIGSTSSITRTVGTPASLIAAGGGSGGGAGAGTGAYPSGIGGSTAGAWANGGTSKSSTLVASNNYTVTGSGITVEISSANRGGSAFGNKGGGGGGGAGGVGGSTSNVQNTVAYGGNGGAGATWPVIGSSRPFAGGGGGNHSSDADANGGGAGGSGGGGTGGSGTIGTPNTGSGGGSKWNYPAGSGGSGICIIAVPI